MSDEITPNPASADTPIPQAPESPIPAVTEAASPIQVEIPTEVAPTPGPIAEPATAQMGGNEPFTPAPAETQPTPTPAETPVAQVETPVSATAEVVADLNSPRLGASGEASATRIEASPQAPLAENINSQTFTKSIRELFTKAQLAIQNRKRKKIDRVMTLFAKQTIITNNEVEKLLHVSDATATRYLSTLEKEGKIKQNAKKGHATSYSKI